MKNLQLAARISSRAACVAILLVAAACGGGKSEQTPSTSEPDTSSPIKDTLVRSNVYDGNRGPDTECLTTTFTWPSSLGASLVSQAFTEVTDVVGVVGRFHTGVDVASAGSPQQAVAITQGRVVGIFDSSKNTIQDAILIAEASPTGNSRLDGVVLLKHTGVDQGVYWSMYGHLDPESIVPFKLGDCIPAGTTFGGTLASQSHHLHVEVKTLPVETNPVQAANSCGASAKCWGYTSLKPALLGYLDPVSLIFGATRQIEPKNFLASGAFNFRASPVRNEYQRGERIFGESAANVSYRVVEIAPTPNVGICGKDWYRVQQVEAPDCYTENQCFQHDPASKLASSFPGNRAESIESAWVCGEAGVFNPASTVVFQRSGADEVLAFSANLISGNDFYVYYFMGYDVLQNPPTNARFWTATRRIDTVRLRIVGGPAQCSDLEAGLVNSAGQTSARLFPTTSDGEFCNFSVDSQTSGVGSYVEVGEEIAAIYLSPDKVNIGAFSLAGSSSNQGKSVNGFNTQDRNGGFAFQFCAGPCDSRF